MKKSIFKICLSALLLSLAYVLPFITNGIPQVGTLISPMHIPAFLAGYLLGPLYGGLVSFIMPFTRYLFFGSPYFPTYISMSFELFAYAYFAGLFKKIFIKKMSNGLSIYISLIISIILGKIVWGIAKYILSFFIYKGFTIEMFFIDGFVSCWLSFIILTILIPPIVLAVDKISNKK